MSDDAGSYGPTSPTGGSGGSGGAGGSGGSGGGSYGGASGSGATGGGSYGTAEPAGYGGATPPPPDRSRRPWIIGVLVAALLLGFAGCLAYGEGGNNGGGGGTTPVAYPTGTSAPPVVPPETPVIYPTETSGPPVVPPDPYPTGTGVPPDPYPPGTPDPPVVPTTTRTPDHVPAGSGGAAAPGQGPGGALVLGGLALCAAGATALVRSRRAGR